MSEGGEPSIFSSPGYCHHFSSVVCRPFVNISHFNFLLRNHWANCNQTLVEWSLEGPLPKLCPVIPTSNQDGYQAKNRKKGDEILIVLCCFSISQNELPVWVPFKIVSDSPTLHSRWLLLLKIEISSIVHCCFSISLNELKF